VKNVKDQRFDSDTINSDEELLEKNRISSINAEKKINSDKKKSVVVLLSIITVALLIILAVVIFIYDKPDSFLTFTKEKKHLIEDISKTVEPVAKIKNVHINKGRDSYAKGFLNNAMSEFTEVIESDASDKEKAVALIYMGMISDDRGNYNKALEFYERAKTYDGKNPDIYKNSAVAYRHKKDFNNAVKNIKQSIKLKPEDINSKILLGNIYYELGRYSDAVEQYRKILEISPDTPSVLFNIGSALLKTGEDFAGMEYLKKAGSADGIGEIAHRAYSKLGVLFTKRLNFELAEKYLKKAISLRPEAPLNRYNLGIAYLKQNKKNKALQEFIKADQLGGNDPELLENTGEAFFSMKEYNRSLDSYKKILTRGEKNIRILSRMADIYYQKGELDTAYKYYKKITVIEPASENARMVYLNMGNILDDTQKYSGAIEAYKKALAINPKDDATLYNMGITYSHAGKPELALKEWKKASQINPANPAPVIARADFYYEKGYYDPAIREYQLITEKWPGTEHAQHAHFKIASIYTLKNEYNYAIKAYNRVIKINNRNDMARKSMIKIALLNAENGNEKKMDSSILLLQKALLLKPGDPESLFAFGKIYSKKGMDEKAIDTFYQVIKASDNSRQTAEAYNNIGRSHFNKKEYKKALQAFTRGIEEDPSNEKIRINRKVAMKAYENELSRNR